MNRDDVPDLEIQALRDRLSRLSEASRRINESLDFDTVLPPSPGSTPQRPPHRGRATV